MAITVTEETKTELSQTYPILKKFRADSPHGSVFLFISLNKGVLLSQGLTLRVVGKTYDIDESQYEAYPGTLTIQNQIGTLWQSK